MSLEQKINYQLNKYPGVKKVVKTVYQHAMYAISPKIKSEGNITRISPDDPSHEYFFGYYDKSPWDSTDRYMLCMRANDTWSDVSPKEKADILLIDTALPETEKNRVKKIAETSSWNVQQSCMLQWLGPDFSSRILYNDYRNGKYVSVIKEVSNDKERIIPAPVYTVSTDGKTALTLDFSRLYNLRPGYGYYNVPEKTKDVALPDATAVWKIDLETEEVTDLLTYKDFATFQPRPEMQEVGSVHKVNHLMLSPNGKRFMVLYRWFIGERKYTRLITCNVDGSDMYVLSDDDMVSHCFWKDDEHILAFENKRDGGTGYYLMKDKSQEYIHCWPELTGDGHPSYCPDRNFIVTDSYPDRARIQYLRIMKDEETKPDIVAKVFSPFKYDNDTRCDLHPRWNHAGDKVCFDSVFEGHRGLYVIPVVFGEVKKEYPRDTSKNNPKYSIITPMFNSFDKMRLFFQTLNNQTYPNFEVIIVDDFSSDGSYTKALQYSKESSIDIKVYKSVENMGPGNARNIGVKEAQGDWILFIDSDDYVDNRLLEELNKGCTESNDIVLYDYCKVVKDREINCNTVEFAEEGFIQNEHAILWATTNVCGKVYKRELLESSGISFPRLSRYEDWVFFISAVLSSNSIYYIKKHLYYYVDNELSIVHTKKNNVYQYSSEALKLMQNKLNKLPEEIIEALYIREVLYVCAREQLYNYDIETLKNTVNGVESKFPKWRRNKYMKHFSGAQRAILGIIASKSYWLLRVAGKIFS